MDTISRSNKPNDPKQKVPYSSVLIQIIHRKVPPQAARKLTAFDPTEPIFDPNGSAIRSRAHSTVKVEDPHYEELSITDEQYAENEVATETTPEKGSKTVIKSK